MEKREQDIAPRIHSNTNVRHIRTYAISRCGICLRVTWGSSGIGASETSRIDEGRMKLITLPVDKTGAVIAIALPLELFVMTGAVMAIAWLLRLAGVPNTLLEIVTTHKQ